MRAPATRKIKRMAAMYKPARKACWFRSSAESPGVIARKSAEVLNGFAIGSSDATVTPA